MLKIGLVDVDSHNFPNLALMKLSTYHKNKGDEVIFHPTPLEPLDIVYQAKVFDNVYTKDDVNIYNAKKVIKGGTGYNLTSKLPYEIEHCYPDYSLYDITDTAYGYLSRGCPRGCSFCIVKEKEGQKAYKVADLTEFWSGQKNIKLLDPNITACPQFEELIEQLIASNAWVDFTQGLDIRLMTEKKAEMLNKVKWKMLHFAWDNPSDTFTLAQLIRFKDIWKYTFRNRRVYVLTNFNSTHEQDLYRVEKLKEIGYDPYIMVFNKPFAPKITRHLQRYVNNKFIFRSCESFSKYMEGKKC